MRFLLHAVAALVAAGFSLPLDAPRSRPDAGEPDASQEVHAWEGASGPSADAIGHGPLRERLLEPRAEPSAPPPRSETERGPAPEPARTARHAYGLCCTHHARWPSALAPGELPEALVFLRVNGSADAHGARA